MQIYISAYNDELVTKFSLLEQCMACAHFWLLHNGLRQKSDVIQITTGRG